MMIANLDGFAVGTMALCTVLLVGSALLLDSLAWKKKKAGGFHPAGKKYAAVGTCVLIAFVATIAGKAQKHVGAPIVSLLIGMLLVNLLPGRTLTEDFRKEASSVGKQSLSYGIVLLGGTLSISGIFSATYALPLIVFNIGLSFSLAYLIGVKVLKASANTATLVGGGTAICGGTAIAALSTVIKAKEEETAYAMAAIFLFDVLACFVYPYLATAIGLNEVQFGFLAGTAINDTSSVVAAQETYANLMNLSHYAIPATIKVVRTTMIIVLVLVLSILTIRKDAANRKRPTAQQANLGKVVWASLPKFILWFVGAAILNTMFALFWPNAGFYARVFTPFFANGYKFLVTIALAGIGFKIKIRDVLSKGGSYILLGGCTWLGLFLSSLLYAMIFV